MAVGFPAKVTYANGDVFNASDINDTNGTINLINPSAKGDIYVGSAANTYTKLSVGTNGQVLTAASGQPTGVQWAAPATGGMTSLATGTLSGTTVTLSSISGSYKNLQLVITKPYGTSLINNIFVEINSDTGTYYKYNYQTIGTASVSAPAISAYWYITGSLPTVSTSSSQIIVDFPDYASTTNKVASSQSIMLNSGGSAASGRFTNLIYNGADAAITSLRIRADVNSFSGGTYTLYGVK